jgi:hypothetical protein
MKRVKQLTVACQNRPGVLAEVARLLGDAKVNILALHATTAGDKGLVGLVVDRPRRAREVLSRAGFSYTEQDALHVELPNVPGALGDLAEKLANKDINITAAYQTAAKKARRAGVVFGVSDLDRAARIR